MKQIRLRAKNRKDPCRKNEPNAIMHYFQNSSAPRVAMDELQNYDPSRVVAPKHADPEKLPELWREILKIPIKPYQATGFETVNVSIAPQDTTNSFPTFTVSVFYDEKLR